MKVIEETKDEVNKSKESHKESLYKLKKAYEKISTFILRAESDIDISVINYLFIFNILLIVLFINFKK